MNQFEQYIAPPAAEVHARLAELIETDGARGLDGLLGAYLADLQPEFTREEMGHNSDVFGYAHVDDDGNEVRLEIQRVHRCMIDNAEGWRLSYKLELLQRTAIAEPQFFVDDAVTVNLDKVAPAPED